MFSSIILVKELAEERYSICKSCPRLTGLKICSICNCIMPIKVKLAKTSCPAGKWPAVDDPTKITDQPYEDLK